ncbi:hypothetical protein FM121_12780 [Vagococcus fluvialis bH819]|uniref:Uncharacterized protein n=1 Tax=Vagococcus fluvialis bH819 TaxID=1255619 RepID=A0A1X6WRP3_9ENTE|nr:hypothetical protein FM121_12780 [Vagococcus fluvialis bH819]
MVIAAILPVGYFFIGILFLGNTIPEAFKESAITFLIMFVIAFGGLLFSKD